MHGVGEIVAEEGLHGVKDASLARDEEGHGNEEDAASYTVAGSLKVFFICFSDSSGRYVVC